MPEIPNTYYRTSIKAIIFDENKKILLTKEDGNNKWDFPGGGMDWGETPQLCLAREIQEEMGIPTTWIAEHPSYFYTAQVNDGRWFAYALYEVAVEHLNFTPSDECTEIKFFSPEDIKNEDIFSNVVKFFSLYDPDRHAS